MGIDSAFAGMPPATPRDQLIIQGFYNSAVKANPLIATKIPPSQGYLLYPARPAHYVYEDRVAHTLASGIITIIFVLSISIARVGLFLSNRSVKLGADDWVYIVAAIIALAHQCEQTELTVVSGLGRHTWDLTYNQLYIAGLHGIISQMVYYLEMATVKISIALFIRRVIGNSSTWWHRATTVYIIVLVIFGLLPFIIYPVTMGDFPACINFIKAGEEGRSCDYGGYERSSLSFSVINAVLDLLLVMAPAGICFSILLPETPKLRLSLLFAIGIITTVTSTARAILSFRIFSLSDQAWSAVVLGYWSDAEVCISFLMANMPLLNMVFMLYIAPHIHFLPSPGTREHGRPYFARGKSSSITLRKNGSGSSHEDQPPVKALDLY